MILYLRISKSYNYYHPYIIDDQLSATASFFPLSKKP